MYKVMQMFHKWGCPICRGMTLDPAPGSRPLVMLLMCSSRAAAFTSFSGTGLRRYSVELSNGSGRILSGHSMLCELDP